MTTGDHLLAAVLAGRTPVVVLADWMIEDAERNGVCRIRHGPRNLSLTFRSNPELRYWWLSILLPEWGEAEDFRLRDSDGGALAETLKIVLDCF